MKGKRVRLVRMVGALLGSISSAFSPDGLGQDISTYSVGKRANYVQTSTTAPTAVQFYQFRAIVDDNAPTGSVASANITFAPGTGASSPQSLSPNSVNHTFAFTSANYGSDADLSADYPNSAYTMNIYHPAPTGTLSSVPLSLAGTSGSSYPSSIPALTNTNWSGGALVIDATQSFAFTWNNFADDGGLAARNIRLTIEPPSGTAVSDNKLSSSVASFVLGSNALTPGTTYTGHLVFNDFYSTDTGSIPGATGSTFYTNRTIFTIAAIPEPSTVPLALGLAVSALVFWRRRG